MQICLNKHPNSKIKSINQITDLSSNYYQDVELVCNLHLHDL